jgi:cysteine desulfurase/selenocysteine lyase
MTAKAPLDPKRIRADFPILARKVNGRPLVYLDNAATSQKPRAMIDRITEIYESDYARAEEGHTLSRHATKAFEGARTKVAKLINAADSKEIVFCRGATEGLNLVAFMIHHGGLKRGEEILVTEAEHHSNIGPWLLICQQTGAKLKVAPVTDSADLDLDALDRLLTKRVKILAVTHVSNVTGGINPVKKITAMAQSKGIMVLVDGAQAVPHIPVDVRDIGCEFYAGSGHKMGGPSSVGFLYGRADVLEAMPLADAGSTMAESMSFTRLEPKPIPHKYEAGEPAFGEVEAWSPAIDYWTMLGMKRIEAYEKDLTEYARAKLAEVPGLRILGDPVERISIVSFVMEGIEAGDVEKKLDNRGIAVRSGTLAAEPLVKRLGAEEAVRASFLFYNLREEVDALAEALHRIAKGR